LPLSSRAAGTDRQNLAFLRLLLGGVGDDDASFRLLFRVDALDDDAIVQRAKLHYVLLSRLRPWGSEGSPARKNLESGNDPSRGITRKISTRPLLVLTSWRGMLFAEQRLQPGVRSEIIARLSLWRNRMASADFRRQPEGFGLTTANILYRMPDHPGILQNYIWQQHDLHPHFPELKKFLDFWTRELDGLLHSVTIAHARLIKPAEFRAVEGEFRLN